MQIDKLIKKQVNLVLATVIIAGFILVSSSYALFTNSFASDVQSLNVGDLSVSFSNGSGGNLTDSNAISLNAVPMSDADATAANYNDNKYAFVITNNGSVAYEYTVQIIEDPAYLVGGANYNASIQPMGTGYIRYKVNNEAADYLENATNGYLLTDTVNPGQSKSYVLRMWVAWETSSGSMIDDEAIGAEAHLKIVIEGEAGEVVTTTAA